MVNSAQKRLVENELVKFFNDNVSQVNLENCVSCPNILLEFNRFHIQQVVDNCQHLFTIKDIVRSVELWRLKYAFQVLIVLANAFGDVDLDIEMQQEDDIVGYDSVISEWSQIRDDSTLLEVLDTNDFEGIDCLVNSFNASTSFF